MEKTLILIAGSPATGKSYLVNLIQTIIPDIFVITPDEGKEILADSIGFNNLKEKAQLEIKVWKFYYEVLSLYMGVGKKVIVSEYPFSHKQYDTFKKLVEKYGYKTITVRLVADFEVLWNRRSLRDTEQDRHLSHIMTHYHYGDYLEDRTQADNLISKSEFKKIIEDRQYNKFQLGELYEYDVTDFSKVDYSDLLEMLKHL